MTTTGSQLRALCLMLLLSATAQAQAGGPVFIQGSEVNLRDKPATNARVVAKVAIGTECQQVKAASKQWVRLRCGDVEGFTLRSLVGAEKPTAEALLAQARDTAQPARSRMDAALRAAILEAKNTQALKLLADLFFDVQFEQLQKDSKKGGLRETFTVTREEREDRSKGPTVMRKETGEEGLLRELERIEYDWHRFQLRDNDFVSAMYRDGALIVYTGYFESLNGLYELKEHEHAFRVGIESRSTLAVPEALKLALQQDARPATPSEQKYSTAEGEHPGMPALSAEALRLLRALPARWYALRKVQGEKYVMMGCGLIFGAELRGDLHRRASIRFGELIGQGDGPPDVLRIVDISKTASGYRLPLRDTRGFQAVLTLTWPTDEANVSRWEFNPPLPFGGEYSVEHARNIRIKDVGCSLD
ncbi:hypothetical protein ACLESO_00145 [Pyxidicoccus sp. 3LG]